MSHIQDDAKSQGSRKSGKLHSAIEQAQAIQQREQLRAMIVDKFNKDFSKGNKNVTKLIEEIVTDYFGKEKVTEDSLRTLKQRVAKAVEDYRKENKSCIHTNIQRREQNQPLASKKSNRGMWRKSVAMPPLKNQQRRSSPSIANLSSRADLVGLLRPVQSHPRVFTK